MLMKEFFFHHQLAQCWKLKNYCEALNTAIVRTTPVLQLKKFPYLIFAENQNFEWVAEHTKCPFGASFSETVKFFNENSFTQKTDYFFSEQGMLLIWSTREYLKLSPMSSSILFTTQSNADVSKCFKNEWSKQNILVSDFRKMFARQISNVQLHWRRLQSKVRKN